MQILRHQIDLNCVIWQIHKYFIPEDDRLFFMFFDVIILRSRSTFFFEFGEFSNFRRGKFHEDSRHIYNSSLRLFISDLSTKNRDFHFYDSFWRKLDWHEQSNTRVEHFRIGSDLAAPILRVGKKFARSGLSKPVVSRKILKETKLRK